MKWTHSLLTQSMAVLALVCTSVSAAALDQESSTLLQSATAAINRDAPSEAIAALEQLADRGVQHPDVSFNRAIAYVKRARSSRAQPGDLGRAVAALEETLAQRASDVEANALLASVQTELSRARSKRGAQSLLVRPSLSHSIVTLLPENFWALTAMMTSLACTLGLITAWLARSARRRFVGKVVASIAGVTCLLAGFVLNAASRIRHEYRVAVVVVPEARLRNAAGMPLPASVTRDSAGIPEGARVDVARVTDRFCAVNWGEVSAFVERGDLELLSQPDRK